MARSSAANPGSRSQQAPRAGARDPWEEAAAAWRSGGSGTPTSQWGTGTWQSTEAPITDTWGWGARPSRVAPVTFDLGTMAPASDTWSPMAPESAPDAWRRIAPERSSFSVPPPSEGELRMSITTGNAKAFLHCRGCSVPLKPPIFQDDAGHAVCLACRDVPLDGGTGWTSRAVLPRRDRFLEDLLEALRVPCPYAAHGCGFTPAYHNLDAHRAACDHAPRTPCPVRGCRFVAPMPLLLDHFAAVHGWPITAEDRVGKSFDIDLCDGFNVVAAAVRDGGNQQHLLLLNVARQPFCRTISAVCIHPQLAVGRSCEAAVTKTVELELCYSAARHYQESVFSVPFVDLTDGLPDELAQFVVPKSVHPDDHAAIPVRAFLTIN